MDYYLQFTNTSANKTYLIDEKLLSEACISECQVEEEVVWVRFVMELILIPIIGSLGVLGNLVSIFVLCKSDQKTTFHQVREYFK